MLVNTEAFAGRDNKLDGEIVNVIREERLWMKQSYWPVEFEKRNGYDDSDSNEDSNVGKMPPASEDEEP